MCLCSHCIKEKRHTNRVILLSWLYIRFLAKWQAIVLNRRLSEAVEMGDF